MPDKKASLFYFTGTGNSKRILTVAGDILKSNGYQVDVYPITENKVPGKDNTLAGFCFPVYSLALPRIALKYLKGLPAVEKPMNAFLFMTGGADDDAGWSMIEGAKILGSKGYQVVYTELFTMPNNWVPFDEVPNAEEAKEILEKAEKKVSETMSRVLNGEIFHKPLNVEKFGYLPSRLLYFIFRGLGVKRIWKFFRANGDCNACGICAKACPTKSISMADKKPKWSKTCEQCMRCINICPKKAVEQLEFIGKGSRRNRYLEPHFHPLAEKPA